MKNQDKMGGDGRVPGVGQFLSADHVAVSIRPQLRTPECPSLGRFIIIIHEPNEMTREEHDHIDSGCTYCSKTIERFTKELETINAEKYANDDLNQPFQELKTEEDNPFLAQSVRVNRKFITKRLHSRWMPAMVLSTLILAAIFGLEHWVPTTTTLHPRTAFHPKTNLSTNTVAVRPKAFLDSSGVSVAFSGRRIKVNGLPPNLRPLIEKALANNQDGILLHSVSGGVGVTAGDVPSKPQAPQHLQPTDRVIVGPPDFNWSRAMRFNSKEYGVEYRQIVTPPRKEPEYKTAGIVPASVTHLRISHLLAPGTYSWHVYAIGSEQPGVQDLYSLEAQFVVVAPEFKTSDLVMGTAYAQVGQWDTAEAHFRHLMQPHAGDINGSAAAEARQATGKALLKWLQNQRRLASKAPPPEQG